MTSAWARPVGPDLSAVDRFTRLGHIEKAVPLVAGQSELARSTEWADLLGSLRHDGLDNEAQMLGLATREGWINGVAARCRRVAYIVALVVGVPAAMGVGTLAFVPALAAACLAFEITRARLVRRHLPGLGPTDRSLVTAYLDAATYATGAGAITPPYALLAVLLGAIFTAFGVPSALGLIHGSNRWAGVAVLATGVAVTGTGALAFRRTTALKHILGFGGRLRPISIHARVLSPTLPAVVSPGVIVFRWPRPLAPAALATVALFISFLGATRGHGVALVVIPGVFLCVAALLLWRLWHTKVTISDDGVTDQSVISSHHYAWDEVSGAKTPESQLASAGGGFPLVLVDNHGVSHGLVTSFGGEQRPAPPGLPSSRQARILIAADVIRARSAAP